ncbi:2-hydroxy-3-oxopropionate reductase [Shimia isoporae]|uniref:2-hydroxy-3-oxopropionate reductase n=1 Tax=Shimia isoporae TaxID=647720 RepID=A0A4R1NBT9_9RHOB|nr:NAD(P)-dependent oxidoreductase [Shimia isoporae]TCL01153.1 2-hydroxy-3-oxopropionate reductase [Shimia isoporae]
MELPKTALLGVGLMGRPMALNLAHGGVPLTVWNRSAGKCEGLEADGITIAPTAESAVANAEVVISMVADGAITKALVETCAPAMDRDAVWVDMSSTKPSDARDVSATLETAGIHFVDAPVSGGTKGAEAGSLAIMAGGDTGVIERIAPVLSLMGRPVRVGPTGSGQLAKLANQAIVAVTIGAVAEAMLLLEEGGADPEAVRDALKGGFADSTILQQHGARMTTRNFDPGGLSRLQLKDLNNALEEALSHSLHLPMTEQVRARFQRYIEDLSGGERDHSGLYQELRDLNGMTQ